MSRRIGKVERLAIFARDGMACVYCNNAVEDGALLTLDHVVTYRDGGATDASNLITACRDCNNRRGCRSLSDFTALCGFDLELVERRITSRLQRDMRSNRLLASRMIRKRGNFRSAFNALCS